MDSVKEFLNSKGTPEFFESLLKFSKLLPDIPFTSAELHDLLQQVHGEVQNNGDTHTLTEGLEKWASNYTEQALESIVLLKNNLDFANYIPWISIGVSKTNSKQRLLDLLLRLLSSEVPDQIVALQSAGRLNYDESEANKSFLKTISEFVSEIIEAKDLNRLSASIEVCGRLIKSLPNSEACLIKASEYSILQSQQTVISCLWLFIDFKESPALFDLILKNLIQTKLEDNEVLHKLEIIFRRLIAYSETERILNSIDLWLRTQKGSKEIKRFNNILAEAYTKDRIAFQRMITRWLGEDERKFQDASRIVIQQNRSASFKNIELDSDTLSSLSTSEINFIACQIVGCFIGKEHLQSMIYSLLNAKPKDREIAWIVKGIFKEFIFYNYPSTKDFLLDKKKTASSLNKRIITEIVNESEEYYKRLDELPRLNELRASEMRLKRYYEVKRLIFQKVMEDTPNKGFLRNLFKEVSTKRGHQLFTKTEGVYSEKTPFSTITSEYEVPRGESISPLDQAKFRYICRMSKK